MRCLLQRTTDRFMTPTATAKLRQINATSGRDTTYVHPIGRTFDRSQSIAKGNLFLQNTHLSTTMHASSPNDRGTI